MAGLGNAVIIGPGAIGCLLYRGLQAHIKVSMRGRREIKAGQQLSFTDITGIKHYFRVEVDDQSPVDLAILTCKAYDIFNAYRHIKHRLHARSLIVLMHNGLGSAEELLTDLPDGVAILAATTTHGALRTAPFEVRHTGKGESVIGCLHGNVSPKQASDLTQLLNSALPPFSWHQDINIALWQKVAVNAIINPLTAIHNVTNGALTNQEFSSNIERLAREIAAVAKASGLNIVAEDVRQRALNVAEKTSPNRSSMLQDINNKRRTEIDYINGFLMGKAATYGIPVPTITALYEQVKSLDRASQD